MKERLDVLLVKRGLAQSREKAKALILSGNVCVEDKNVCKAGIEFTDTVNICILGDPEKYVGRGGYKLEKAVNEFHIELAGKICLDVGASTGGFTDCMLQNGAVKIYSVDVGTNQLAKKLREEERVICMERTNARYLTKQQIKDSIAFASIDVSFISLTKVLEPIRELLTEDGSVVALVKPQFEAGRELVGKKGVVKDANVQANVIDMVAAYASGIGFLIQNLSYSPIKGPEGNIEFLMELKKTKECQIYQEQMRFPIKSVVEQAHKALDG